MDMIVNMVMKFEIIEMLDFFLDFFVYRLLTSNAC